MLMAQMSRGRKLYEVVVCSMFGPIGFCLVWFSIWGGIGLRQSRQGKELEALGLEHYNNSRHFLADGSDFCFDVPQTDLKIGESRIFTNSLLGVTPVCQFDSNNANVAVFDVLDSFKFSTSDGHMGLGPCLSVLFILSIAVHNVASSSAATLVVDSLASNGRKNYHWTRRMFWACTVVALTTALLSSGGADALNAVNSASVVCALPVAILMCYLTQSITLMCQAAEEQDDVNDYQFPDQPEFDMPIYGGVFNLIEYMLGCGRLSEARAEHMRPPSRYEVRQTAFGLLFPFTLMYHVLSSSYPRNARANAAVTAAYAMSYYGWIAAFVGSFSFPGLHGLTWTLFVCSGGILGMVRWGFRAHHNLRSNNVGDFVSSALLWPQVLTQMHVQGSALEKPTEAKGQD
jgi:BCCT, betaine/carnitine/choline family transporter